MSDSSIVEQIIKNTLPLYAMFGKENFAGDEDVEIFYNSLSYQYDLNINVYVSWCCEPSAMLLQSKYGSLLVRSERMDTLMIEYIHLREILHNKSYSEQFLADVSGATVLQWLTEFFIGYNLPSHALSAWELSRNISPVSMDTHPYRDDSLASIPHDLRVAIQCFSIAHEIGHILYKRDGKLSLNEKIDGLELMKHVEHDLRDAEIPLKSREILKEKICQGINPAILLDEIDADLFALYCVTNFLVQRFTISLEDAVKNSLYAFEALAYMNSCKFDCSLLKRQQKTIDFKTQSFINGTALSIRSRCVMRRAGFIWAEFENPGKKLKGTDINKYVLLVDNLYSGSENILNILTEKTVEYLDQLYREFKGINTINRLSKFKKQIRNLNKTPDQRYNLWKILIAFGCPGGTDVNDFFKSRFSLTKS